jgi:hypothetical protein
MKLTIEADLDRVLGVIGKRGARRLKKFKIADCRLEIAG